MQNKIQTAVEFLKEGKSFKVGDLRLNMENSESLQVIGWSQYVNLENVTQKIALEELEEIKEIFQEMVDASSELNEFIKDKSLEFNLWFDSSGKSSVKICSEQDGKISWVI